MRDFCRLWLPVSVLLFSLIGVQDTSFSNDPFTELQNRIEAKKKKEASKNPARARYLKAIKGEKKAKGFPGLKNDFSRKISWDASHLFGGNAKYQNLQIDIKLKQRDIEESSAELQHISELPSEVLKLGYSPWKSVAEKNGMYALLVANNKPRTKAVASAFRKLGQRLGLGKEGVAKLIISYAQRMPYLIPGRGARAKESLGLYSPPEALYRHRGDCDSKSLLIVTLLENIGVNGVMFSTSRYAHAVAGAAIKGEGLSFEIEGMTYYMIEAVSPLKIGTLASKWNKKEFWHPLPLR